MVTLRFDPQGSLTVEKLWAANGRSAQLGDSVKNAYLDVMGSYAYMLIDFDENGNQFDSGISVNPKNMTITMGIPEKITHQDGIYGLNHALLQGSFQRAGLPLLFGLVLVLTAIFGLLCGSAKKWNWGNGPVLRHIPLEILLAADVLAGVGFYYALTAGMTALAEQEQGMSFMLPIFTTAEMKVASLVLWALIAAFYFASFLSYGKVFALGLKTYLAQRSLIAMLCIAIGRICKKVWCSVADIQLEKSEQKTVAAIVLLNGFIMLVISCLWFAGIPLVIAYGVFLYWQLKKRYSKIKTDYETVLEGSQRMAQGNLNAKITETAGVFEPVKENLNQMQAGLKKAVDAEVKSQNMKTELITNVSHDLKTPLTAIITYVDLLKKPDITPEERQNYIETLDKKSQRLKQLIADLFDVSKASSGDVKLELAPLDLCALLEQVRCELADKLEASEIDFRWKLPLEKTTVLLDGARTYRIFENLLVNITKYGLPKTRAYVELEKSEEAAKISFKNVSAQELEGAVENLTERFVRGDTARSTEGSGLGLAIAKSFTELQKGSFAISTDGDLFKVEIRFPLYQAQQEPVALEGAVSVPFMEEPADPAAQTEE